MDIEFGVELKHRIIVEPKRRKKNFPMDSVGFLDILFLFFKASQTVTSSDALDTKKITNDDDDKHQQHHHHLDQDIEIVNIFPSFFWFRSRIFFLSSISICSILYKHTHTYRLLS